MKKLLSVILVTLFTVCVAYPQKGKAQKRRTSATTTTTTTTTVDSTAIILPVVPSDNTTILDVFSTLDVQPQIQAYQLNSLIVNVAARFTSVPNAIAYGMTYMVKKGCTNADYWNYWNNAAQVERINGDCYMQGYMQSPSYNPDYTFRTPSPFVSYNYYTVRPVTVIIKTRLANMQMVYSIPYVVN